VRSSAAATAFAGARKETMWLIAFITDDFYKHHIHVSLGQVEQ